MLSTTAELMRQATGSGRPLLAFNVITLEHAEAIADAADEVGASVLLQISENAIRYHGRPAPLVAATLAVASASTVPLAVHLDHLEDLDLLHQAADLGVSSVMFDASRLPDDENVRMTRQAADWAHSQQLYLEAELGAIGGKGGAHTPGVRTDPAEAAGFVAATGVDALAVAVGSSHAMTERSASLDQQLIRALAAAVPVPLVLHGSSGVTEASLRQAVTSGIVKINIGTLLNVAFTASIRQTLADQPELVDPRRYLRPARTSTASAVAAVLRALTRVV